MKKKVLAMVLTAVCAMGLMAGCGNSGNAATGTQNAATESGYKVGISQFAEHGSLDNCREGFLEGLKEEGIEEGKNLTVDYQNAQTDTGTASTIADSFVSAKDDLICAIATPCAASAYNSTMNTDIPVVYTAVSDPVSAGLANEDGSSIGNITGSSDILPVEEQLKMIRAMLPDAKKIGILYTTSEANSCSTIEEYKKTVRPKVVMTWAPHPRPLPQAVPNSFAEWMNATDYDFVITHPEGYELAPQFVGNAKVEYDQMKAFEGADFIYAKNWAAYAGDNYGQILSKDREWTVSDRQMEVTNNAFFMHCLPVRRNMIVTDDVIESPQSIVIPEAANREISATVVLKKLLESL